MAWLKKDSRLKGHPKLITTAGALGIKPVYLEGHLDSMWLEALTRYEDGDLSKLTNEEIAVLAEWNVNTADRFVEVLIEKRWLDNRLIHDWLDYVGDYLKSKYRKSPAKLIAIFKKHGREHELPKWCTSGTCTGNVPDMSGTSQDIDNPVTHNNPVTQKKDQNKTQGVVGEDDACELSVTQPSGFSTSSFPGSWASGPPEPKEIPWDSLDASHLFAVFRDVFLDSGIPSATDLSVKARKSKVTPVRWVMLFFDKLQYAQSADGSDPVALTVSGFRQGHSPSDSAGALLREILVDKAGSSDGRGKRFGMLDSTFIATELAKRKGRKAAG